MIHTHKREVCEQQADELVDELDVQKNFSSNSMVRTPNLFEVYERVYCGEECTIQPSPPLRDEFRYGIWKVSAILLYYDSTSPLTRYVCLSRCALNVLQHPPFISLCYELPTKYSILCKIHVCSEDIGVLSMQRLSFKILTQWPMTSGVILQCVVTVGTQCSR